MRVLGIDVGASKTECLLADGKGVVLGKARGPGGNFQLYDEDEVEFEDGVLEIESSSFTLKVTATDNTPTPNTSMASTVPSFSNLDECTD